MSADTKSQANSPQAWSDDLTAARADLAAGRVREIDLEALCREIEAEATDLEARLLRRSGAPSRT